MNNKRERLLSGARENMGDVCEREPRTLAKIRVFLDDAERHVANNSIVASVLVEQLAEAIEDANRSGADLSSIEGLNDKLDKLRKKAPLAEIRGSITFAKNLVGRPNEKLGVAGWYWRAVDKLDTYRSQLDEEDVVMITRELEHIKRELGM